MVLSHLKCLFLENVLKNTALIIKTIWGPVTKKQISTDLNNYLLIQVEYPLSKVLMPECFRVQIFLDLGDIASWTSRIQNWNVPLSIYNILEFGLIVFSLCMSLV